MTRACLAEAIGTFLMVLLGLGVVHAAVIGGAPLGLVEVATVWGVAVTLGILATAASSGAHLNPAVTLANAAWRGFPWRRVAPYIAAQLVGAILAAALLHLLWSDSIRHFEIGHGLLRGGPGSELSAMVYGEYFPNPAMPGQVVVGQAAAMLPEGLGTALLVLVIFAVGDPRSPARPDPRLVAPIIGVTIAILISIIAPLTQAGFNPARDFGPRLVAFCAGWGGVAIPGPQGGFCFVYILAPILGGLLGGGAWMLLARRLSTPRVSPESTP